MDKQEMIRQRAYEIWVEHGHIEGQADAHWEQARREIEAASPAEPDANGPTGAVMPDTGTSTEPTGENPVQPKGDQLKEATELG
jgi:hypothetical protein